MQLNEKPKFKFEGEGLLMAYVQPGAIGLRKHGSIPVVNSSVRDGVITVAPRE